MSIHKRVAKSGKATWIVRYREAAANRAATFDSRRDARAFESQVRLSKRKGELAQLDSGRIRIADFGKVWWEDYVKLSLAESTRHTYKVIWNNHILPYLGNVTLRELSPRVITAWRADLERSGKGAQTIKKSMGVLQSCLQYAVTTGDLQVNPMREVKKPAVRRTRAVRPLVPREIEMMRSHLICERKHRDATVVSLLAYAGLRPGEAFALTWDHVRPNTLLIEQAASFGELKETKTGRIRAVKLFDALREDLDDWRSRSPGEAGSLIFPGPASDRPMSHEAIKSWSRRSFRTAAVAAGRQDATPYSLRHSFASLLIHEGRSVVEVAQELGHAPTMTLSTYAHVMAELAGDRRSADSLIAEARTAQARRDAAICRAMERGTEHANRRKSR